MNIRKGIFFNLVMLQINKEKLLVKLNKNFNSFKKINGVIILYLIYFPLLLTYRSFAIVAQNVEELNISLLTLKD